MEISMIYRQTNSRLFASSVAFFVFLAIFPTVLLVFSIIPFTPLTEEFFLDFLEKVLPNALDNLTVNIISQLYGNSTSLFWLSILLLIWSSAKGFQGIKSGLNVLHGVSEMSNFIMLRLKAIMYSLLFSIALIISVSVIVFINYIYDLLGSYFDFKLVWLEAIFNYRYLVQWFLYAFFLTFIYAWVPDKKTRPRKQWRGALFTGTMWTLFNFGFNFYLANFSTFNIYGSMATVIILLFWIYSLSFIFMYGGIINVYFNDQKAKEKQIDSTE